MLKVTPIPCLEDNYAYLLDDGSGQLAVVDASEGAPVLAALERAQGDLTAIFATHHHFDHVGGNEEILARRGNVRVYGYESDRGRIPCQTEFLRDGQTFTWGKTEVRALHIPGHTMGAVAYVLDDAVFTGDTLFLAGCGRLFEGTPAMMFRSLCEVLAPLGREVRVFCGHEYTLGNLAFAASVEPGNTQVAQRLEHARALRARGEPTVGSPMAEELATNPFMRCQSDEIRRSMKLGPDTPDVEVLAALRRAKDSFRAPKAP
ncbi:MAG TPA: hydroxyacylglutathione hydrolase [Polyangiaceae bacterium]|nr:hydroxyacylglutathione hydrolase [Polyangiaceae bacterium]